MKIYCTGYNGMIGRVLATLGHKPLECDVTNYEEVDRAITKADPDVIVHLASKSDVDWCEDPANQSMVIAVNVRGAWNVASVAEQNKIPVIVFSTDHIFDGKRGPYKEDASAVNPQNYYGLSKLAMEGLMSGFKNVKIIRTSFLFDKDRMNKMMRNASVEKTDFATFIVRTPMLVNHFAESLDRFANRVFEMPKILNISGSEKVTLYELALACASYADIDKENIIPRTKEDKSFVARRPRKGGLIVSQSAKLRLPQYSYTDGLKEIITKASTA